MVKLPEEIEKRINDLFPKESEREQAKLIITPIFNQDWKINSTELSLSILELSGGNLERLKTVSNFDDPRQVIEQAKNS